MMKTKNKYFVFKERILTAETQEQLGEIMDTCLSDLGSSPQKMKTFFKVTISILIELL